MKRFWKVAAWTLLFLVLTSGVWVGSIALGWLAVPKFVTDQVAKVKSLTEDQAAKLNRTVNLYRVIKNSPEAPVLNEALSLLTAGPSSDAAWVSFAQTYYPTLSADTLDKIREQLGVAPEDFAIVKGVLDDQIARSRQTGAFDLTPEQAEQLAQFDQKYGLVETLRKLQ